MSGGSFNYLCYKDLSEIAGDFDLRETLESMQGVLKGLGTAKKAARDTQTVIDYLAFAGKAGIINEEVGFGFSLDALKEVWKAVEWFYSNDTGKDDLAKSVAAYEGLDGKPSNPNVLVPIPADQAYALLVYLEAGGLSFNEEVSPALKAIEAALAAQGLYQAKD